MTPPKTTEDLLYLVHRIPFPPDKGDKISSFNYLRYFSSRYRVHLATFIDDPADEKYRDDVVKMCASHWIGKLGPVSKVRGALKALATGKAISVASYENSALRDWVGQTVQQHNVKKALVYSSGVAHYAITPQISSIVVDFADVDSEKWRQYARTKSWPLSWLYGREAAKLLAYDRSIAVSAKSAVLRTKPEAALFVELAPEVAPFVKVVNNGVDADYFSPAHALASPYATDAQVVVYTGVMDYWPNVDAVTWFAQEVLPLLKRTHPAIQFYIVGSRPSPEVKKLAEADRAVTVTNRVPDVRPYVAHAKVAVVPNRIGRGVANKSLEALALGKPLVTNEIAAFGLESVVQGVEYVTAHDAPNYAREVAALIDDPRRAAAMGAAGRERMLKDFNWDRNIAKIDGWLQEPR